MLLCLQLHFAKHLLKTDEPALATGEAAPEGGFKAARSSALWFLSGDGVRLDNEYQAGVQLAWEFWNAWYMEAAAYQPFWLAQCLLVYYAFVGLLNNFPLAVFWAIFNGICLLICRKGWYRIDAGVLQAGFLPSTM